jgi:hypothetical protein
MSKRRRNNKRVRQLTLTKALKIMRDWFRMNRPPDDLPQIVGRCLCEAPGDFNRVCEILKDRFGVEMEPDELQAFMMMVIDYTQKMRTRCN